MMETKKITVIVPVYNVEKYIERCVNSICAQTYRNLEIILVDDGSTDATGRICNDLAEKDVRIQVFHKANGGSSSARNLGIEKASGDYFGFVDSDDYIEPSMYETLLMVAQKFKTPIAQIGRREITEGGVELPRITSPPTEDVISHPKEFLAELLMHRGDCSFCTKLISKELFWEDRFPIGVLNEDFYLLVKMLARGNAIAFSKESAYFVCYRIGSNTRKASKEQFSRVYGDCVDNADMVETLVQSRYPELVPIAFRFGMFQRNEYLLHIPIGMMNRENEQYVQIKKYVRKNTWKGLRNLYLTKKNKMYLFLFACSPKMIRLIHKKVKHLD